MYYWIIVVSPLVKGELINQTQASLIIWPPKAHSTSRKTVVPPAAECGRIFQSKSEKFLVKISIRKADIHQDSISML